MKNSLIILFLILSLYIKGQTTVQYAYDASGNRISRTVASNSRSIQPFQQADGYSELFSHGGISLLINSSSKTLKVEMSVWNDETTGIISVFSLSGRELVSSAIKDKITTLQLGLLPHGIYILSVSSDGERKTCKFNL